MRSGSTGSPGEMVDSNVFVYAADPGAGDRRTRSLALIDDLRRRGALVVSAQVLNEVYSAVTRPGRPPCLPHTDARQFVEDIAAAALVVPLTAAVTLRALDAVERHQMSWWDALIWAAAREGGVSVIHTEGLPGLPEIEGVRNLNPFP